MERQNTSTISRLRAETERLEAENAELERSNLEMHVISLRTKKERLLAEYVGLRRELERQLTTETSSLQVQAASSHSVDHCTAPWGGVANQENRTSFNSEYEKLTLQILRRKTIVDRIEGIKLLYELQKKAIESLKEFPDLSTNTLEEEESLKELEKVHEITLAEMEDFWLHS